MNNFLSYNFKLKGPNESLSVLGIALLLLIVVSAYSNSIKVVVLVGFITKILVLIWMPKAASLAGRNKLGWTIFAFLIPSVAFIILGNIGYKKTPEIEALIRKCSIDIMKKSEELNKLLVEGELTSAETENELQNFISNTQKHAKEQVSAAYDTSNNAYLTERLRKKGYIISDDSDVFIDYKDKCPGCGAVLTPGAEHCPECGLVF